LSFLGRLIEEKTLMKNVKFSFNQYNNDHFIFDVTHLLTTLLNRLSPDEKERFVELCSTKEVCQVFVDSFDDPAFCEMSWWIVEKLMENRLFVKQLIECGIAEPLREYRFSIKDKLHYEDDRQRIDNILSVLLASAIPV